MKTLRIAMCQITCVDGDREGNFARIEDAISEAGRANVQLACFPETALLGWVNPEARSTACPIPGADSQRLCQLAAENRMYLCVGVAEKDGDDLYDSALLIDSDGNILLKHRKMNILAELMDPPYRAGREVAVVQTEFGRTGLLICADTHDPEILARMAKLGPELLLVPYGYAAPAEDWPGHGAELARVVAESAARTRAAVIGTNVVGQMTHGPWRGRIYGGQSVAADKKGRIAAVAADRCRDIKVIRLDSAGRII